MSTEATGEHSEVQVLEIAIEPKSKADREKLDAALQRLTEQDPSFSFSTDVESGQTILKGTGELHLETKVDILRRIYNVEAKIGAPQVAYRETLSRSVTIDYIHKKQTGGWGQYARVKIEFEPLPSGSGFEFEDVVKGGAVPEEFIPAVEKALKAAKEGGLLIGFPMIDFKASLVDGDSHEMDSSTLAFEIAAHAAFRELGNRGIVKLLQPIMKVAVVTPEDYFGDVLGDLNSRRGFILDVTTRDNSAIINAHVPMTMMFGYFR